MGVMHRELQVVVNVSAQLDIQVFIVRMQYLVQV